MNDHVSNRRTFLKQSARAAASVLPATVTLLRCRNSADRIRVGFIGVGNRGSQLLDGFITQPDVDIVALCDVYEPYLQRDYSKIEPQVIRSCGLRVLPRMNEKLSSTVRRYRDFRQLLEQKDIDAVVVATPDHWHAIQTIQACQAGKDVYVEKPLSMTIVEGRKMVETAQRYNRVVQVGLHRRSSAGYREVGRLVRSGRIGAVKLAQAYRVSNMAPSGIGRYPDTMPPPSLNWDMWLGPRAYRPYRYNIAPYRFRWWADYSSQMANWGVHYCDAIRWVLGQEAPLAVTAQGNMIGVDDDRTIPVNMEATFEMANGLTIVFGQYEGSGGKALAAGEVEFCGSQGHLYSGDNGVDYKIVPSSPGMAAEAQQFGGDGEELTNRHIRNFLDCIKSRQSPACNLETGHRSTTFALLANIALKVRARIVWDPVQERIVSHHAANKLLHYEYRQPWSLPT